MYASRFVKIKKSQDKAKKEKERKISKFIPSCKSKYSQMINNLLNK